MRPVPSYREEVLVVRTIGFLKKIEKQFGNKKYIDRLTSSLITDL